MPPEAPTADRTRRRVLTAVRTAGDPVTIEEVVTEVGVHPNTVRFHLATLEREGLVVQGRRPSGGKGRPRAVYSATRRGARSGQRNYQLLASVLVRHLASTSRRPAATAQGAGRAWGRQLVAARGPARSPVRAVLSTLDDMGFEPEPRPVRRPREIHLHNCPFRELVDTDQELVCAVHAGVLQGLVEDGEVSLEPFATAGTCLVRLG